LRSQVYSGASDPGPSVVTVPDRILMGDAPDRRLGVAPHINPVLPIRIGFAVPFPGAGPRSRETALTAPGQENDRHGIGGNSPPDPLDQDHIGSELRDRHRALVERVSDIDAAVSFTLPESIPDQAEAERMAEFLVQCKRALQDVKAQTVQELAPYGAAVDTVKGFFTSLADKITAARAVVDARILSWNALQREIAAAEAWRPRGGEAMLRYAAGIILSDIEIRHLRHLRYIDDKGAVRAPGLAAKLDYQEAQEAAQELAKAKAANITPTSPPAPTVAAMPPPPPRVTTIRSSRGAAVGERVTYSARITDESLVPREYCSPDDGKLKAAIRLANRDQDGKPVIEIPGVVIDEVRGTVARG
jgi:hypothetical protein